MALNKYFNMEIIHNGTDITEFCGVKNFVATDRNLDCSQVFSKLNLDISLLAGVAFTIKEQDLFFVRFENVAHYYRVTRIEDTSTNRKIELTNVFELLEDRRFYTGEEGSEVLNPLLSSFVDGAGLIITNDISTLLQMICHLAVEAEVSSAITFENEWKSWNPATDSITITSNPGQAIIYNNDISQWGKDITPSELLKNLQLEYCFSLKASSVYNAGFENEILPTLEIKTDYTIPAGDQLSMPEFFRVDTINKLLNPLKSLNKTYYNERPVLITKKKKGIEIKDASATFFTFEYRNDLEFEVIEYPDNFNLNYHFTPIKIQFDGVNYILKAGYYNAYHHYFSYTDIIQNPSTKLDYQLPTGYQKTDYKFTNEDNEEAFIDSGNARRCVFDNAKFSIILTDNRIVERNNIRG